MKPLFIQLAKKRRVLMGRGEGEAVAARIESGFKKKQTVVLGFAGVEMVTPSFLDAIFTRTKGYLGRPEQPLLLAVGMNDDVSETVILVLRHNKLMLATMQNDALELLGGSQQLKETLEAASRRLEFTPKDLADELAVKLPALHQRLKALTEAGAIKQLGSKRGKSDVYGSLDVRELKQLTNA